MICRVTPWVYWLKCWSQLPPLGPSPGPFAPLGQLGVACYTRFPPHQARYCLYIYVQHMWRFLFWRLTWFGPGRLLEAYQEINLASDLVPDLEPGLVLSLVSHLVPHLVPHMVPAVVADLVPARSGSGARQGLGKKTCPTHHETKLTPPYIYILYIYMN
jgi:hypothetical protein